jgi:hypothetical protein
LDIGCGQALKAANIGGVQELQMRKLMLGGPLAIGGAGGF